MALLALDACKTQALGSREESASGDAAAAPLPATSSSSPPLPASPDPLTGEWERQTAPYKGMRVVVRHDGDASVATTVAVSRPPTGGAGESNAVRRAELDCQRSLWKPGEPLVTNLRRTPGGASAYEGTIVVRDWGFSGQCRHADARAPARLTLPDASGDRLVITVTRGKTATQEWTRVPR